MGSIPFLEFPMEQIPPVKIAPCLHKNPVLGKESKTPFGGEIPLLRSWTAATRMHMLPLQITGTTTMCPRIVSNSIYGPPALGMGKNAPCWFGYMEEALRTETGLSRMATTEKILPKKERPYLCPSTIALGLLDSPISLEWVEKSMRLQEMSAN